jgi:hypothetical protein
MYLDHPKWELVSGTEMSQSRLWQLWRINHSSQSKVVDPKKIPSASHGASPAHASHAEQSHALQVPVLQSKRISISPVSPFRPSLAATRASSTTPISPLLSLCLFFPFTFCSFTHAPPPSFTLFSAAFVKLPYASSTPTVCAVVSPGLAPGRTVTSPTAPLSATNTIFIRGASHATCRRLFPHVHEKLPAVTKRASQHAFE